MGIKDKFIGKKIEEVKEKADSLIATVTHKTFDMNLLRAIKKDFGFLIEQQNDLIKGEVFLYQILKEIAIKNEIKIPEHIKNHFRL